MPSVTRDKRKYGVPSVLGDTSENRKRAQADREEARADEMRRDNEARYHGNEFYHTGRIRPLIDEYAEPPPSMRGPRRRPQRRV